jgi:hypothetical protein
MQIHMTNNAQELLALLDIGSKDDFINSIVPSGMILPITVSTRLHVTMANDGDLVVCVRHARDATSAFARSSRSTSMSFP